MYRYGLFIGIGYRLNIGIGISLKFLYWCIPSISTGEQQALTIDFMKKKTHQKHLKIQSEQGVASFGLEHKWDYFEKAGNKHKEGEATLMDIQAATLNDIHCDSLCDSAE